VRLHDRAGERVESYSRGMKQRLHIAKTLIHNPRVVILDEPTIGLDPGAAIDVRELVADLVPGHTVLLTTHDMHEADILCRELAIIDRGRIVAAGTPAELKAATAIDRRIVVTLGGLPDDLGGITRRLRENGAIVSVTHRNDDAGLTELDIVCTDTTAALDASLALLREHGASVQAIDIREPSLEDAFLRATGREFEPTTAEANEPA
jgi:ABC-2 type transport system ATP-binding protein